MVGPTDTSYFSLVVVISPGYNAILVLVVVIFIVEATLLKVNMAYLMGFSFSYS